VQFIQTLPGHFFKMKPLILHGHERSITSVKYSREGDLIFSSAKDHTPNVWFSLNGERLGTFDGHQGAVWSIDINWETTRFLSGAADNSLRMWDCETGIQLGKIDTNSAVRTSAFSFSGNQAVYTTDSKMKQPCEMFLIDVRTSDNSIDGAEPIIRLQMEKDKTVTSVLWGPLDETVITGHENGDIMQWDLRTGKLCNIVSEHGNYVNDMQHSKDQTMFITASKDSTAKLFDIDTLECMKTYKTERPVNSAAISPIMDHVVLGGGQEAMDVTTTSTRIGKFDARFFHLIFEEEFGRVKGHFGPINSCQFHPDGKSYASGGEDGYVRVHFFDPSYFDLKFEY